MSSQNNLNVQESIYSFLTDQHLNCALAPGLQFDTLELRNPLGAAWLGSLPYHVQVVRNIHHSEAGVREFNNGFGRQGARRRLYGLKCQIVGVSAIERLIVCPSHINTGFCRGQFELRGVEAIDCAGRLDACPVAAPLASTVGVSCLLSLAWENDGIATRL